MREFNVKRSIVNGNTINIVAAENSNNGEVIFVQIKGTKEVPTRICIE